MNPYERLPVVIKVVHLLLLIAPVATAGLMTQSWKTAGETFLFGTLFLGGSLTFAAGRIAKAVVSTTGDDDVDAYRFHRAFIWPFLLTGPLAGAAVAYLAVT